MALPERDSRISRRSWLLAGLAIPLFRARAAGDLAVTFDGDNIHIADSGLHFISGRALTRLKDADTVTFFSQITLFSDDRGTVFKRAAERVVVSYALWEEKFAVTIPGTSLRSTMHSTAAQAEAWIVDNLAISALGLAPDRPFWLRFELRAASQRELSAVVGDTGISVRGLVEFFSRKSGADDPTLVRTAGPLRLSRLSRTFRGRTG